MRRSTHRSLDRPKNRILTAAQWLVAAAVIVFAFRALRGQWDSVAVIAATLKPQWIPIALGTGLVFAAYALLIEVWRRMIAAPDTDLPFHTAARIWLVSNLGKYVPGKFWSIASMALMARERGVPGASAATSAVVVQIASLASGVAVIAATGSRVLDRPELAIAVTAVAVAILVATPYLVAPAFRLFRRMSGRDMEDPVISRTSIWAAVAGSAVAWVMYGLAFRLFAGGVLDRPSGAPGPYVAVYAASYIIGFLAFFAPGGAAVREGALVAGMTKLGLASAPEALIVALTSRAWLTVTELLPGFLALAINRRRSGLSQ